MKWNDQVLTDEDIEQIYLDLINEYGLKLPPQERKIARELFLKLRNAGRSWEWIYWAVWQLGERKVVNNKGLFFYVDYQNEVSDIATNANEYIFHELTMEQLMEEYVQWIALYEENNPQYNEVYDRLVYFDDKYWNTEDEFTEEEMDELVQFYKWIIKAQLRITKAEYELERKYISEALRRMGSKVYDVPPHPFVDMQFYKIEPTEEQKKLGLQFGFYKE